MYPLILVPVDDSETARHGLEEAIVLAKALGSTLRIANVVDLRLLPAEISAHTSVGQLIEEWREAGCALVAAGAARARAAGVRAEEAVLCDPGLRVADLIVEEARRCKAALIVMGTHGRRGLRRMTLGSDAELVVREAPVPVLLVRSSRGAAAAAQAAQTAKAA